jgi:hypothetical protein
MTTTYDASGKVIRRETNPATPRLPMTRAAAMSDGSRRTAKA